MHSGAPRGTHRSEFHGGHAVLTCLVPTLRRSPAEDALTPRETSRLKRGPSRARSRLAAARAGRSHVSHARARTETAGEAGVRPHVAIARWVAYLQAVYVLMVSWPDSPAEGADQD